MGQISLFFELSFEKYSTRCFEILQRTSRPPSLWTDLTVGLQVTSGCEPLSPWIITDSIQQFGPRHCSNPSFKSSDSVDLFFSVSIFLPVYLSYPLSRLLESKVLLFSAWMVWFTSHQHRFKDRDASYLWVITSSSCKCHGLAEGLQRFCLLTV